MTTVSKVCSYFLASALLAYQANADKTTYITLDKDVKVWIFYENSSTFTIKVNLPRHWWLALSYGGSHVDSDIVVFKANGYDSRG